jgi:hypothetical protein
MTRGEGVRRHRLPAAAGRTKAFVRRVSDPPDESNMKIGGLPFANAVGGL